MPTEDLETVGRQAREARTKAHEAERRAEAAEAHAKQATALSGSIADATAKELKRIEEKVDKGFSRVLTLLDGDDGDLERGLRWRVAQHENRLNGLDRMFADRKQVSTTWIMAAAAVVAALSGAGASIIAAMIGKGHP